MNSGHWAPSPGGYVWGELFRVGVEVLVGAVASSCDAASGGLCLGATPEFWDVMEFAVRAYSDIAAFREDG
jgi:hypothetical protein